MWAGGAGRCGGMGQRGAARVAQQQRHQRRAHTHTSYALPDSPCWYPILRPGPSPQVQEEQAALQRRLDELKRQQAALAAGAPLPVPPPAVGERPSKRAKPEKAALTIGQALQQIGPDKHPLMVRHWGREGGCGTAGRAVLPAILAACLPASRALSLPASAPLPPSGCLDTQLQHKAGPEGAVRQVPLAAAAV